MFAGTLCGECSGEREGVSALLNECVSCPKYSALLIVALGKKYSFNGHNVMHAHISGGRYCCATCYYSPKHSPSIMDNSILILHSGIIIDNHGACKIFLVFLISLFHLTIQLASIVGLYFPPSFIQVGKYVSEL